MENIRERDKSRSQKELPHCIAKRELDSIAKALVLKLRALLLFFLWLLSSSGVISAKASSIAACDRWGEASQYWSFES